MSVTPTKEPRIRFNFLSRRRPEVLQAKDRERGARYRYFSLPYMSKLYLREVAPFEISGLNFNASEVKRTKSNGCRSVATSNTRVWISEQKNVSGYSRRERQEIERIAKEAESCFPMLFC